LSPYPGDQLQVQLPQKLSVDNSPLLIALACIRIGTKIVGPFRIFEMVALFVEEYLVVAIASVMLDAAYATSSKSFLMIHNVLAVMRFNKIQKLWKRRDESELSPCVKQMCENLMAARNVA
jgi:NADPH-dependent 7-cyano-7-deazaguanine reductase QueF-like protein